MKKIKKALFIITLLIVSILFIPKANAKMLTAQELVNRMKDVLSVNLPQEDLDELIKVNGDIIEWYDPNSGEIAEEIDCSEGSVKLSERSDLRLPMQFISIQHTFGVKSNYIEEYLNNMSSNFSTNESLAEEFASLANASKEEQDVFFNKYGLISYVDSETGKMITKWSLDTDMWDVFFSNAYVLNQNSENYEKNKLVPTIKENDVGPDSVKLELEVTDPDGLASSIEKKCFIYRSTEEDGMYRRIQDEPVDCSKTVTVTDSGLNPPTTYYYKARLAYTIEYSSVLTVTTNAPTTTTTTTEKKETTTKLIINPQTGDKIIFLALLVLSCVVAAVIALKRVKKLNN